MSEHDISDKLAIKFLPKVTVLIASDKKELVELIEKQDYGKITIRTMIEGMSIPQFFNSMIDETRTLTDIYVFITETAFIANPTAISRLVEKFLVDDMIYAGIYTDSFRIENGYVAAEFLPAFEPKLILTQMVTNNPLVVQSKFLPQKPFKEGVKNLFFFNLIREVGTINVITHLAEPLYNVVRQQMDIQSDLNTILNE